MVDYKILEMKNHTALVEFINPYGLDNHVRLINLPTIAEDGDLANAQLTRISEVGQGVSVKMLYDYNIKQENLVQEVVVPNNLIADVEDSVGLLLEETSKPKKKKK